MALDKTLAPQTGTAARVLYNCLYSSFLDILTSFAMLPVPLKGGGVDAGHNQERLHKLAQTQPWYMFTGEEIAVICNVSQNVISRVKAMADSPFFLNKCRPEWFVEWMRVHPHFQLTKANPNLPGQQLNPSHARTAPLPAVRPKIIKARTPQPKRRAGQQP